MVTILSVTCGPVDVGVKDIKFSVGGLDPEFDNHHRDYTALIPSNQFTIYVQAIHNISTVTYVDGDKSGKDRVSFSIDFDKVKSKSTLTFRVSLPNDPNGVFEFTITAVQTYNVLNNLTLSCDRIYPSFSLAHLVYNVTCSNSSAVIVDASAPFSSDKIKVSSQDQVVNGTDNTTHAQFSLDDVANRNITITVYHSREKPREYKLFVHHDQSNRLAKSTLYTIIGCSVGGLLLVFIVVYYYVSENSRNKYELVRLVSSPKSSASLSGLSSRREEIENNDRSLLVTGATSQTNLAWLDAQYDRLDRRYTQLSENNKQGLKDEYQAAQDVGHPLSSHSRKRANEKKNRFSNVMAYDHSRVCLAPIPNQKNSDYINANYINGYNEQKFFVATQGPMERTVGDFWRMVWQEDIPNIVMLCKLGGRSCFRYWTENGTHVTDDFQIRHISSIPSKDYTVREFRMFHSENMANERCIRHFSYDIWPDHGVPAEESSLMEFVHQVQTSQYPGRQVVHCTAGVGRTGTYIAAFNLAMMVHDIRRPSNAFLDVQGQVHEMRQARNLMVQTFSQYEFIYKCILWLLEQALKEFDDLQGDETMEVELASPLIYEAAAESP